MPKDSETARRSEEQVEVGSPKVTPEMIQGLADVVGHPEFTALMHEIESKPAKERLMYAKRLATVRGLTRRGIPLPEGVRITTRAFEAPDASTLRLEKLDEDVLGEPDELSFTVTVCVTVGPPLIGLSVGATFEVDW